MAELVVGELVEALNAETGDLTVGGDFSHFTLVFAGVLMVFDAETGRFTLGEDFSHCILMFTGVLAVRSLGDI